MNRLLTYLLITICMCVSPKAHANVAVTFYSHEFGQYFPHAFFTAKGKIDGNGQAIDTAYGFTAVSTSPAILMGSVKGHVKAPSASYIAKSTAHFTVRLNDGEYAALMQMVDKWQKLPDKSYNLGRRNCVHFIMDAVATSGLALNRKTKFVKKPRSFLNEVKGLNPGLKL
jgi:hypothetical protein